MQNVIAATKQTKQEKRNVVLSLAHDGVKYADVVSTDKIDEVALRDQLNKANLHSWDTIVRFTVVGALQEFRFSWDDRSIPNTDVKKRTKNYKFQSIDFEGIETAINRIVADLSKGIVASTSGSAPSTL